jgi:hypothetical protein
MEVVTGGCWGRTEPWPAQVFDQILFNSYASQAQRASLSRSLVSLSLPTERKPRPWEWRRIYQFRRKKHEGISGGHMRQTGRAAARSLGAARGLPHLQPAGTAAGDLAAGERLSD